MQTLGMLLKEKKSSTITFVVSTMVVVVGAFIASTVRGIVSVREGEGAGPTTPVSLTTTARFDPQRFILNGLLVPGIDTDAVLRWVDPRPAIQCRPGRACASMACRWFLGTSFPTRLSSSNGTQTVVGLSARRDRASTAT